MSISISYCQTFWTLVHNVVLTELTVPMRGSPDFCISSNIWTELWVFMSPLDQYLSFVTPLPSCDVPNVHNFSLVEIQMPDCPGFHCTDYRNTAHLERITGFCEFIGSIPLIWDISLLLLCTKLKKILFINNSMYVHTDFKMTRKIIMIFGWHTTFKKIGLKDFSEFSDQWFEF